MCRAGLRSADLEPFSSQLIKGFCVGYLEERVGEDLHCVELAKIMHIPYACLMVWVKRHIPFTAILCGPICCAGAHLVNKLVLAWFDWRKRLVRICPILD